jgi:hypothetical protein
MVFVYAFLIVSSFLIIVLTKDSISNKDFEKSNVLCTNNKDDERGNTVFVDDVDSTVNLQIAEKFDGINPFDNEEFKNLFYEYVKLKKMEMEIKNKLNLVCIDPEYLYYKYEQKLVNSVKESFLRRLNKQYSTETFQNVADRIKGINNKKYLTFDFHELTLDKAKSFFKIIYLFCKRNEFDFQIIHGYRSGTAIKDFIEQINLGDYERLKELHNEGVTMFCMKNRSKKCISDIINELASKKSIYLKNQKEKICEQYAKEKNILDETTKKLIKKRIIGNAGWFYFLISKLDLENYIKIPQIYDALYKLDGLQRNVLLNVYLGYSQDSYNIVVNKPFLIATKYCMDYCEHNKYDLTFEYISENDDFYICIDAKVLNKIIILLFKFKTSYRFASILVLYSKLNEKERKKLYSYLFEDKQIFEADSVALEALRFLFSNATLKESGVNLSAIGYYHSNPSKGLYIHWLLLGYEEKAERLTKLSNEQREWVVSIEKRQKRMDQIPIRILDENLKNVLGI